MPVVEARNQVPIERNHVYVIPPNHDMVIEHGCLGLSRSSGARSGPMPIDRFFRSLADDQGYVTHSNVNAVEEMVNMIVGQRAYEINSKAVQASDEMLQTANNLRR